MGYRELVEVEKRGYENGKRDAITALEKVLESFRFDSGSPTAKVLNSVLDEILEKVSNELT
jgi:hypothetical protein